MNRVQKYFNKLQHELIKAAEAQNRYDFETVNLIAPASPTSMKYFSDYHLHNAIAEGLLNNRPYAGAEAFNKIEKIAAKVACQLFSADHANVQPHSVSQANQAVYQALLKNGDKVLAMKFHAGGHLTHGLNINFSGRFFNFKFYGVNSKGFIDYKEIEKIALRVKPKMMVCGASSYPRKIEFVKLKNIADKVGAYLLADLSHPAGLIVTGKFPQPFPYCDVVTFTPDKTLLGPHGGIILCKKELSDQIDKAVHPGVQSSVPLRRIFHTALNLIDAGKPEFRKFINRLLINMKVFEKEFSKYPGLMITGGSDTHLMVLNTYKTFGLKGNEAEKLLEDIGILTNRQVIPNEQFGPYVASGIRLGATWITARGCSANDTRLIAKIILANLENPNDLKLQKKSKQKLSMFLSVKRKNDVWNDEINKKLEI
ncbi:serine hydroxymethyltransferase [Patescibacteria group bacterium]|nr:serine hydroxymethyltransferase [Patescibacteria group bacterium]